ncbi:hypothetical protein FYJ59_07425 [Lachnospiraceae bacterium WCA3-601-WT-6H]|uniref:Uncharacterized protein n=1 Tax=Waltera intestinalis TaxID=2606635 RepID=A0A6L5YKA3_9FIRM|nr:hypothetical protein [Waltera intestinalis]
MSFEGLYLQLHGTDDSDFFHECFPVLSYNNIIYDAYGLFRATHSHNPTRYSHIVRLSSHFYAHIGAGSKVFHPLMSELMRA